MKEIFEHLPLAVEQFIKPKWEYGIFLDVFETYYCIHVQSVGKKSTHPITFNRLILVEKNEKKNILLRIRYSFNLYKKNIFEVRLYSEDQSHTKTQ